MCTWIFCAYSTGYSDSYINWKKELNWTAYYFHYDIFFSFKKVTINKPSTLKLKYTIDAESSEHAKVGGTGRNSKGKKRLEENMPRILQRTAVQLAKTEQGKILLCKKIFKMIKQTLLGDIFSKYIRNLSSFLLKKELTKSVTWNHN